VNEHDLNVNLVKLVNISTIIDYSTSRNIYEEKRRE